MISEVFSNLNEPVFCRCFTSSFLLSLGVLQAGTKLRAGHPGVGRGSQRLRSPFSGASTCSQGMAGAGGQGLRLVPSTWHNQRTPGGNGDASEGARRGTTPSAGLSTATPGTLLPGEGRRSPGGRGRRQVKEGAGAGRGERRAGPGSPRSGAERPPAEPSRSRAEVRARSPQRRSGEPPFPPAPSSLSGPLAWLPPPLRGSPTRRAGSPLPPFFLLFSLSLLLSPGEAPAGHGRRGGALEWGVRACPRLAPPPAPRRLLQVPAAGRFPQEAAPCAPRAVGQGDKSPRTSPG